MARSACLSKLSRNLFFIYSLGHWCEVNDELMNTLSKYEPPLDVVERDSTFLKIDRNANHIALCSQSNYIIYDLSF